jgi:hypothetical protein
MLNDRIDEKQLFISKNDIEAAIDVSNSTISRERLTEIRRQNAMPNLKCGKDIEWLQNFGSKWKVRCPRENKTSI